jgi:hypothetical protein
MRFFVPHSLDNDTRSIIGAAATFVVALLVLGIANFRRM